ncbi:MAG: D-sedoheptulose 7-phosphate isomerase [Bacteroidales bacterium]|nr:D-sedoheptulose 7-phosphate isomerase [Bacteroidales bacterium]
MKIQQIIEQSIKVKQELLNQSHVLESIQKSVDVIVDCYKHNGKVLFCGNGGSAADCQHLAAELSGRFYFDREPLYAEALHVNTSYLTAVSNDYSFDIVFSRMVKASGKPSDVLVGISTSGNSQNIINAMLEAKNKGMYTIAMTGSTGGKMKDIADILINVPSTDIPRIQESHIMIGHIICEEVESTLFTKK